MIKHRRDKIERLKRMMADMQKPSKPKPKAKAKMEESEEPKKRKKRIKKK